MNTSEITLTWFTGTIIDHQRVKAWPMVLLAPDRDFVQVGSHESRHRTAGDFEEVEVRHATPPDN
jgi:hypothetical protein